MIVYLSHILLGFVSAFLGSIPPGMLTMTATKISLENESKSSSILFAIGVSLIVIIQAYLAILFTKYLKTIPGILSILEIVGFIVFLTLTIYFYLSSKNKKNVKNLRGKRNNSFLLGVALSSMNVLAIPYYCGVSTVLDLYGLIELYQSYIFSFAIGASIGTFAIIAVYVKFAEYVKSKIYNMTQDINRILSGVFAILTIILMVRILF